LPPKPVDVGRYDVVFNASAIADIMEQSLVPWASVSHERPLEDPLAVLGQKQVAGPAVTLRADRSRPDGWATTKWDDEGVAPDDYTLIQDGVLVDYLTTREEVGWLAPYYARHGKPVKSHGCACASGAYYSPLAVPPNLALEPGKAEVSFEELVSDTRRGVACLGYPDGLREIVDGKLGAPLAGGMLYVNLEKFWKQVAVLGGPKSVCREDRKAGRGLPRQVSPYSLYAVPAKVPKLAVIDESRKA
jgi:TldD protein